MALRRSIEHLECVKVLVEHRADLTLKNETERSALAVAVSNGHAECVELLAQYGSDVNAEAIYGLSPVHIAVFCGHPAVIRVLEKFGADLDAEDHYGRTPLGIAQAQGRHECKAVLIECYCRRKGTPVRIERLEVSSEAEAGIRIGDMGSVLL